MSGPTALDKLLIAPALTWVLARTLVAVPGSFFRGKDGADSALEHVANTGVRTLITTMSSGQLQLLLPSFESAYKSWCKKHKHPLDIVDIPGTDARGFWIGNKDAEYNMVFYHGGGFVMPGTSPHLEMLMRFVQWSNSKLAIFCVAYTLAPLKTYPTQLSESVEGLRYVLSLPGRSPSKTLLGGDSAGGNLLLAVLSHISGHPNNHPSNLVKPLDISEKLFGGIAIAPWVSSDHSRFTSMRQYEDRDIVGPTNAEYWIECYKGGKGIKDDEYVTAEIASPSWWANSKISRILCVTGEHESLRDGILAWAENFQQGAKGVEFKCVIGKRETHDAPLQGLSEKKLAGNEEQCQEAAIRAWIRKNLA